MEALNLFHNDSEYCKISFIWSPLYLDKISSRQSELCIKDPNSSFNEYLPLIINEENVNNIKTAVTALETKLRVGLELSMPKDLRKPDIITSYDNLSKLVKNITEKTIDETKFDVLTRYDVASNSENTKVHVSNFKKVKRLLYLFDSQLPRNVSVIEGEKNLLADVLSLDLEEEKLLYKAIDVLIDKQKDTTNKKVVLNEQDQVKILEILLGDKPKANIEKLEIARNALRLYSSILKLEILSSMANDVNKALLDSNLNQVIPLRHSFTEQLQMFGTPVTDNNHGLNLKEVPVPFNDDDESYKSSDLNLLFPTDFTNDSAHSTRIKFPSVYDVPNWVIPADRPRPLQSNSIAVIRYTSFDNSLMDTIKQREIENLERFDDYNVPEYNIRDDIKEWKLITELLFYTQQKCLDTPSNHKRVLWNCLGLSITYESLAIHALNFHHGDWDYCKQNDPKTPLKTNNSLSRGNDDFEPFIKNPDGTYRRLRISGPDKNILIQSLKSYQAQVRQRIVRTIYYVDKEKGKISMR